MAVVNLNVNQITGTSSKHGTSFRSWQDQIFLQEGPLDLNLLIIVCNVIFGSWPWVVVHVSSVISNAVRNTGVGIDTITPSNVQCAGAGRWEE